MRLNIKNAIAVGWIVLLASVLALGLLARFSFPEAKSVWSDELFSLAVSSPDKSLLSTIESSIRDDMNPPLYQLLLRLYFFAATFSVDSARMFSAFFGALGVVAIALFVYLWRNAREALFVGALLALHDMLFFYSQEIRQYSLLIFLLGVGLLSWQLGKKNMSQAWFAVSGLVFGSIAFTHYVAGLFSIIFISTGFGLAARERRRFFNPEIASVLTLAATLFFLVPYLATHLLKEDFWIPIPEAIDILRLFSSLAGGKFALLSMIGLGIWRGLRSVDLEKSEVHLILAIFIFGLTVLVFAMLRFPIFIPRVFIVLAPVFVVLIGVSICKVTDAKSVKMLLIAVLAFPTFLASPNAFDRRGHGHNPKALVEFIGSNLQWSGMCQKEPDSIRVLFEIYGYPEAFRVNVPELQPGTRCWLISIHRAQDAERLLDGWEFQVIQQKVQAREAAYLIELVRVAQPLG